jgi:type IV secretion system protein VirB10
MSDVVIDAGAVLDERDAKRAEAQAGNVETEVEGARGAAGLKGTRRPWPVGARTFFVISGLVIASIATVLLVKARRVGAQDKMRARQPAAADRVEKRVPDLKLAAVPTQAVGARAPGTHPSPSAEEAGPGTRPAPQGPSEAELVQQRRLARGFGSSDTEGGSGGTGREAPAPAAAPGPGGLALAAGVTGAGKPGGGGRIEEKLETVELKAASAGMLPDRDYLLTQGAMLDCVLETKVISTVAGMTSCHLTRDIYSANGRAVLLDRGSKVVGRYEGGMQQGQARIFVLWTRVETPSGVVVELQSPGTGALGEAGLGGAVDTHFWDRFGAAILLSIIGDGVDAVAARAAGPQSTSITFTNQAAAGKEVVARSLEPTIGISPTLYKNQGERLGILVARDLDFRSVYGLARSARSER